ncbi:hypothetical protein PF001_g11933 [Phytophthora fragariae]|uniref:UvrD-like helicase C-terminal domain-containing protein n=1 Tax=Phytophthora fragariae TaxID=53985 RepID=A0A6A4DG30_9STRA|nr:hypothetical protein PF001_g11933 [Phytophthora fragariae]
MAAQLDRVARRSLQRAALLRQRWPCRGHTRRLFSSVSSVHAPNADVSTRSSGSRSGHQSLVTNVPNLLALQRVRWLLQQPQRRVLLLTGSSASDSAARAALERDAPAFELERRGHGVFGVREFCPLLLRESGHERRVFGRAQLAALLLHNGLELPGASRLAATSTLQRRKAVQDLLQLFRLLEREGVTPEQYAAAAVAGGEQAPQELAEMYRLYQELLLQHNATSWDGLVTDVLAMCGLQQGAGNAAATAFSESVLREYTDVVLDDVQRMTPAMARIAGHLCGQPSVLSSASFSRVLLEGDECPQTKILERQLVNTAAGTRCPRAVERIALDTRDDVKREKMRTFARQVLTQSGGATEGIASPVPLKCWHFGASEAEERSIGAYLADWLATDGSGHVTVLCPSYADASRVSLAFRKQGLPVQLDGDRFSSVVNSSGAPIHLFDEPGVNAVYSLLCALCFPSNSRHLYNVLRSDLFAFPAELLSWLMERERRSHTDLFPVLEAFVETRGKSLGASSLNQREGDELELPSVVSSQLDSGVEIAESFVRIIRRLRAECHQLSAAEVVQSFLEETGRLESLLSPNSPEQERESLVLADFLRELETAQNVVKSAQVAFVAPYLQQLRETNLTSSAAWEEVSLEISTHASEAVAEGSYIRVLPLTSYALESLAAIASDKQTDGKHILVLMSMRDSKFPGRMKRLTLPLPYDLLSEPFPVQTRSEHLEQSERLAYEALALGEYDEVVLSFAELASSSSSKREVLSQTFRPIWHEGDQPAPAPNDKGCSPGKSGSDTMPPQRTQPSNESSSTKNFATPDTVAPAQETSTFWLADVVGFLREFVHRVLLRREKILPSRDASTSLKTGASHAIENQPRRDRGPSEGVATTTYRSSAPAASIPYEPPHLSYSQISEYLRCPHRYYLGRVMKLNGDVSTSMMFGRALHEGIAAFANSLAASERSGDQTNEAKTLAAVEAEEAFMRAWAGDGYGLYASKEQASFLLDRGMMALWDFIETHHGDLKLQEIVHVEKGFAFHVPEANVEFRGVWDRIDRVRSVSGGEQSPVVIKEFKSNMGGAARNMRKLADESLQLKMYMYAFRKVFGEAPYGAKLQQIGGNYAESKTRRRISRAGNDDDGFVHFSEEAAQEAEAAIVEVAKGLRSGSFEPKPSYAECAFCPYAGSACHSATDEASYDRQSARRSIAKQ